ncbi:hypothetical protein BV22DRAFT_1017243 [Leucogyrophana mollusca]|uniref:Uncharacterized protein n=1 Tax=Leucogyrophana mollusca TaxID=85980 RepID=A0ACB8BB48_9AGAM|nr:hypothetical protein BV22DRAFT_1017243 [Leucogyrophana mollusca]
MNVTTAIVDKTLYTRQHSLENTYNFEPRDGWQTVNVTNLRYKYNRAPAKPGATAAKKKLPKQPPGRLAKKPSRPHKSQPKGEQLNTPKKGIGAAVKGLVHTVAGLVGLGIPEPVIITWYTGHDLENPSCWRNGGWAPTDQSMVAALTAVGWKEKPKCFGFLELCNNDKTCVFVRVVDTCAGCAEGSKHVDLTKEAFTRLGTLDEGILTVQMRLASEPTEW